MFSDFRFGHLGYWVSLLAIAIMGVALHVMTTRVQRSWASQENTMTALQRLTEFSEAASAAESAHRAWIISRTPDLNADRDRELQAAHAALQRMRTLLAANPAKLEDVSRLQRLLDQRREVMRRGEEIRRFGEPHRAMRVATAAAARETMDQLVAQRTMMRAALEAQVAAERDAQRALTARADLALVFAGGLMVLVLIPAYFGFMREAAARTRAEALLRDVTENLPGAVFRLRRSPSGEARFEFLTANTATVRGLGRDALLADARALESNMHADDIPAVRAAVTAAGVHPEGVEYRFRVIERDGRKRWLQTSAQPRREPDGTVLWHGHWIDITEKRALEDALVKAKERAENMNRAKSMFLAAMSHEIRTPMTGVLGMLEVVAMGPLEDGQREAVAVVRESSEALLRIVNDILDFSKVEAGKLKLRPQPAAVGCIARRVVELYGAMARKKGLDLACRVDPALHEAYLVDAVRLQQIVSNLTSNALKFTDRGGVELHVSRDLHGGGGDVVRFTVRDSGRGITPEDRARLFKPFEQVAEAGGGGTGLGLSISHALSQLMGGSLALESEPGKGTVATLLLTLERTAAPESEPLHAAGAGGPGARRTPRANAPRVLIVDDHPINRLVLDRQVTMLGYLAETAASAEEALQRMWERSYCALLADVNMPDVDGYALARLVRERERREGLPRTVIVACTANALSGDDARCLDAGMDDYLPKPVSLSRLEATLERWVPPARSEGGHDADR